MINCPLPSEIFKCANQGAKHLQFVRSIPTTAIISKREKEGALGKIFALLLDTLVGQKANRNVKRNLEITLTPKLTEEEFWEFLIPSKRDQDQEEIISNI